MKRISALLLALIMMFALCACGGDDKTNTTSTGSGEIDRYASAGEIPELDVKLGTSVADVKTMYPDDYEGADESKVLLHEVEGNLAVSLVTLNATFYYEKANIDHGISVIAVMGGSAFGIEIGNTTTKSDVTAKLSAEYSEGTVTAEQQYFLPVVSDSCEVLSAAYDTYRLDFFFVDEILAAVTLTDTAYWTD